MRHHDYKYKRGGYWRGRNKNTGDHFTVQESRSSGGLGLLLLAIVGVGIAVFSSLRIGEKD
ncbi:MAG: hypothetical protein ABI743_07160 [bacterium]